MNIGLLLISTGKYHVFVEHIIASARRFFLKNHKVTFFLFTDSEDYLGRDTNREDVVAIQHVHRPWPYPTLYRYKTFYDNRKYLEGMDYLFYCDVDMLFVDEVGDEILGERVATQHPGYAGTQGTPERNPQSLAYLPVHADNQYFAGGFNGGTKDEYLKMCETINRNIDLDLQKGIIAVWHDESHMNNYFYYNKPTVILDPGYCYGESMRLPYRRRLLALNKNHEEIRSI